MGRSRRKLKQNKANLFQSWQEGDQRPLQPAFKRAEKKIEKRKKESGVETDMTEAEMALEELIEKEDAAETKQRVVDNQKKVKDSQDRENAGKFSSYNKINSSSSIEPSL